MKSSVPGEISSQRLRELGDDLRAAGQIYGFGVDMVSYDWVKLYAKEKEAREEIKNLQGKCIGIQKLPLDKEQLKAAFRESMAQLRQGRLNFLREHIKQAQQQDVALLSPASIQESPHALARIAYLNYDLTDQEIDSLFEGLAQGMTQEEKHKQIVAVEQEIKKLEEMIEKKLMSPKERWFYSTDGERMPYPQGCRWTWFVKTWEEVASRHIGPVDINGYQLETTEEHAAYELLKLGDVPKRTPIKEGAKR